MTNAELIERVQAVKLKAGKAEYLKHLRGEPLTRAEANLFFRMVSYRYQRGSMCLTSNKGIKDWPQMLAGDEVIAAAILDRLLHASHVLNVRGRSYRLRDLEETLKRESQSRDAAVPKPETVAHAPTISAASE